MESTYNILDFETTGLSPQFDRIIEVGAVKVKNGEVIDRFESLINPNQLLQAVITRITGITNDMIDRAEPATVVLPKLVDFLGTDVTLAHNAQFDSSFLYAELERAGINYYSEFLCTLQLSRRVLQDLPSHKLSALCDYFGVKNESSHRALSDVMATQGVFSHMCEIIKDASHNPDLTVRDMLELSKISKTKVNDWIATLEPTAPSLF